MKMIFHRNNCQGFTLPELITSASLIGALGLAVLVAKAGNPHSETLIRASSNQVLKACELARTQAATLHQVQHLRLDRVAHRLVIEPEPGRGVHDAVTCALDSHIFLEISNSSITNDAPMRQPTEGADVRIDTINFSPDGTAENASIRLLDHTGTEFFIEVARSNQRLANITRLGE